MALMLSPARTAKHVPVAALMPMLRTRAAVKKFASRVRHVPRAVMIPIVKRRLHQLILARLCQPLLPRTFAPFTPVAGIGIVRFGPLRLTNCRFDHADPFRQTSWLD